MNTRVIISGFPKILGKNMWEKTLYCRHNLDLLRKAIALLPRGYKTLLGAILTEPCNPNADAGIIYFHYGGYLNSCGDSTFSACKVLLEFGMIEKREPLTGIKLDTAGGLLRCQAEVKEGVVGHISYEGVPSFYQESCVLDVQGIGKVPVDIAFGGLWFVIADSEDVGIAIDLKNAEQLTEAGMAIIDAANKNVKVLHPQNPDLNKITIVQISGKSTSAEHAYRPCNVYIPAQFGISPGGTSVSAKLATKIVKGELGMDEELIVESLANPELVMKGKALTKVKIGECDGIIPKISARPFILGINQWIIEEGDPIASGFQVG